MLLQLRYIISDVVTCGFEKKKPFLKWYNKIGRPQRWKDHKGHLIGCALAFRGYSSINLGTNSHQMSTTLVVYVWTPNVQLFDRISLAREM